MALGGFFSVIHAKKTLTSALSQRERKFRFALSAIPAEAGIQFFGKVFALNTRYRIKSGMAEESELNCAFQSEAVIRFFSAASALLSKQLHTQPV